MARKRVKVSEYVRIRNGRVEKVKAHSRKDRIRKKYNKKTKSIILKHPTKTLVGNQTLFAAPKYQRYNKIVSFKSENKAMISSNKLNNEFHESKSKVKKLRVARVTQYSANRARASFRRDNLSDEKREEMKKITKVYGRTAVLMWKEYRKL